MPHSPQKYLHDVEDSCRFLMQFTAQRSEGDYRDDRGFRSAVQRELQVIGEAVMQLARAYPNVAARISEHQRIIGFRNVLVHGYDSLDTPTVWSIVRDRVPELQREAEALIHELDQAGESPDTPAPPAIG